MPKDPFALDMEAGKNQKDVLKGNNRSLGIPCPKKNYGRSCPICDKAARLFATNNPQDGVLARKIYVKKQPMCNVEFLHERGKVYLMTLPVTAATDFLDGVYETMTWGNVVHPAPPKEDTSSGLPLVLSKVKGTQYTEYKLSPKATASVAERRISSKEVLNKRYSFKNIIERLDKGEIENIFNHRADLQVGNKVEFKILPNADDPSQSPIFIGYYHFGVTREEVYGIKGSSTSQEEALDLGSESPLSADDLGIDGVGDLGVDDAGLNLDNEELDLSDFS